MALGMTFALALGEIDISVGSGYYLTAVVVSQLLIRGVNPWVAALVGLVVGTVLGFLNGAISLMLRIPVLIVSIGTLSLYAGLGLVISGGQDVVINNASSSFFKVASASPGGVPAGVIAFVFVMVCAHVLLQWTRFGYRVQATGSNPEAAVLAGIPTRRTRLQVLSILGFTVGLTGVLSVGYFEAVDASVGSGYALLVLSAVIIGGTSLTGGWGTIIGTTLGILVLAEINTGIVYLGISANYSQVVTGAMILIAVALDRLIRHPTARQAVWRRLRSALLTSPTQKGVN
jgi:ribose transport system permease protein